MEEEQGDVKFLVEESTGFCVKPQKKKRRAKLVLQAEAVKVRPLLERVARIAVPEVLAVLVQVRKVPAQKMQSKIGLGKSFGLVLEDRCEESAFLAVLHGIDQQEERHNLDEDASAKGFGSV